MTYVQGTRRRRGASRGRARTRAGPPFSFRPTRAPRPPRPARSAADKERGTKRGQRSSQFLIVIYYDAYSSDLGVDEAEILRLHLDVGVDDVAPPLLVRGEHLAVPLGAVHALVLHPGLPAFGAHRPRLVRAGRIRAHVDVFFE